MNKVLIVDFGSQYTQLIARRVREAGVYAEIVPCTRVPAPDGETAGVILSGSPFGVNAPGAPDYEFSARVPTLAICYGAQLAAKKFGGRVESSDKREYGRAALMLAGASRLFDGVANGATVWMSHGDAVAELPQGSVLAARTDAIPIAAFELPEKNIFAVQFHPEVFHSDCGPQILNNFLYKICGAAGGWTAEAFIESAVAEVRAQVGETGRVVCALSGGVDSSVAAMLVHRAVGERLTCVFIDNGLLRMDEFVSVRNGYRDFGLNLVAVDASDEFLSALDGVSDPESKRKIIGAKFIDVFEREARKTESDYLVQGTIYPDVIESVSVVGPSATIKSHHNVGGLPEKMRMKVVEPLRYLFKDEVRRVGRALGLPAELLGRHPFPGPGLAIRIIGAVTRPALETLRAADHIFISELRSSGEYDKVWQAFCVLTPVRSVGVMGDERTYENMLALRAVTSSDGMTADWAPLPYPLLAKVSNRIINEVKGVNRVVYDVSSKPPATIEWE